MNLVNWWPTVWIAADCLVALVAILFARPFRFPVRTAFQGRISRPDRLPLHLPPIGNSPSGPARAALSGSGERLNAKSFRITGWTCGSARCVPQCAVVCVSHFVIVVRKIGAAQSAAAPGAPPTTSDEEKEKIESKKDPRWTIVSSSRASQVVPENNGDGGTGRECIEDGTLRWSPLKKIMVKKINFDGVLFFETFKKNFIFRRDDLRFPTKNIT